MNSRKPESERTPTLKIIFTDKEKKIVQSIKNNYRRAPNIRLDDVH